MKERKLNIEKMFEVLFFVLLVIQVSILLWFNLKKIPYMLDADAADAFYHMVQIVKNGTLDIPNWHHTTTLEIDSALLFALPIYMLSGNLFVSIGMANLFIIALYISVIGAIMHYANVNRVFIWMTLCFIFNPWSFGMLDYINMLFFGASQYSIKALLPLLAVLISILFTQYAHLTKKGRIFAYLTGIMYMALLFITSMSTGSYVILCGILPVMLSMILDFILRGTVEGKYKIPRFAFFVLSMIVFLAGYLVYKKMFELPSKYNMNLTKMDDYESLIKACFMGIFQLFGAVTNEPVKGLSLEGIYYCCKKAVVVFLLIASFSQILDIFRKKHKEWIKRTLNVTFLFNFILLMIYDTRFSGVQALEYRYLIIGIVPLIVFAGILLSDWKTNWNSFQRYSIYAICGILLIICMVGNNRQLFNNLDKSTYAMEITNYINEIPVESVIFVNDENTANLCRALDTKHKYGAFNSEEQKMYLSICSYKDEETGQYYGKNNAIAIVTNTNLTDYLSEDVSVHYTKVGTVKWYDIYVSDQKAIYL